MSLDELLDEARRRIRRYTPEEARAAADAGAAILDLRSADARRRDGTVPGAHHVPRTVLEWRVASAEWSNPAFVGRRLILLCDHGYSSVLAAANLVSLGCDAGDVEGGFEAWRAAGLATGTPAAYDGIPGMAPADA